MPPPGRQVLDTSEACSTSEVTNGFKETELGLIPADWDAVAVAAVVAQTISGDW